MKRCMVLFAVAALMIFPTAGPVYAQDAADTMAEDPAFDDTEDINYSYGTVISASGEQLVVLEYDYDQDTEVEITYQVPAATEFNGVNALSELKKDDNIEIYFREVGNDKITEIIALEILVPEVDIIDLPIETEPAG